MSFKDYPYLENHDFTEHDLNVVLSISEKLSTNRVDNETAHLRELVLRYDTALYNLYKTATEKIKDYETEIQILKCGPKKSHKELEFQKFKEYELKLKDYEHIKRRYAQTSATLDTVRQHNTILQTNLQKAEAETLQKKGSIERSSILERARLEVNETVSIDLKIPPLRRAAPTPELLSTPSPAEVDTDFVNFSLDLWKDDEKSSQPNNIPATIAKEHASPKELLLKAYTGISDMLTCSRCNLQCNESDLLVSRFCGHSMCSVCVKKYNPQECPHADHQHTFNPPTNGFCRLEQNTLVVVRDCISECLTKS